MPLTETKQNLASQTLNTDNFQVSQTSFKPDFRSHYTSLSEMRRSEPPKNYQIDYRDCGSHILLIAPHGGFLEPGTSQLVTHLANDSFSYYNFQGNTEPHDPKLHVTSTRYNCPELNKLLEKSKLAITFHGCLELGEVVYLGGLDYLHKAKLKHQLSQAGIKVSEHPLYLGESTNNICNRGQLMRGIQIELSKGLQNALADNQQYPGHTETLISVMNSFLNELEVSLAKS